MKKIKSCTEGWMDALEPDLPPAFDRVSFLWRGKLWERTVISAGPAYDDKQSAATRLRVFSVD